MMSRTDHTSQPVDGDYILSFTGSTWNVLRSTGRDSATSVTTGDKTRKAALARIRSLSETDQADGWEVDGPNLFRQITRFRR